MHMLKEKTSPKIPDKLKHLNKKFWSRNFVGARQFYGFF